MQSSCFRRDKRAAVVLGLLLWTGFSGTAAADDTPQLTWKPGWRRFSTAQYVLTGVMGAGLLATDRLLGPSAQPRWQGGILLDDPASSLLGANSERGRALAGDVSDYLAFGLMLYPFVVDTLLVAGAVHKSPDVAWQMAMIGLQSMAMAKLITGLTKDLVGRERPDSKNCKEGDELSCGGRNESFISGHTAGAFAGAGLICAHHQNLPLYGNNAAGAVACGVSLGAATTVGALRIAAGRHYLSDVVAGAIVGLASGYLLPNLLNYDFGKSRRDSGGTVVPMVGNGTFGLNYVGQW